MSANSVRYSRQAICACTKRACFPGTGLVHAQEEHASPALANQMCTASWQTQPALLGGVLKLASCPAIPQCGVSSAGRLHGPRVPPPFPRVDVRVELCLQPQHVLARERSPATVTRRLRPMAPAPAVEGRAGVAIAIAPVHQCVIHTRVASWPPTTPPPHPTHTH